MAATAASIASALSFAAVSFVFFASASFFCESFFEPVWARLFDLLSLSSSESLSSLLSESESLLDFFLSFFFFFFLDSYSFFFFSSTSNYSYFFKFIYFSVNILFPSSKYYFNSFFLITILFIASFNALFANPCWLAANGFNSLTCSSLLSMACLASYKFLSIFFIEFLNKIVYFSVSVIPDVSFSSFNSVRVSFFFGSSSMSSSSSFRNSPSNLVAYTFFSDAWGLISIFF